MKLVISLYTGKNSEYVFDFPTTVEIAEGWCYEVPDDKAQRWFTALADWETVQQEIEMWVNEHPNAATEPEPEEGGLESMYPE